ncbi:glycoside hydrolase family 3 N-terminal domain-containing protein [Tessaracoccus aquimaris]|uniref:glycoside hydrolase family 3 N-terminal domain-containing protein n=1 Tax=Tessaracoccus aquimaris TaxID=1332264 RepID=UPI0009898FBA|nr:glycoside hydrolase family 3 N-terminal domain-containing protein [Tessaracoccus aquimaris]
MNARFGVAALAAAAVLAGCAPQLPVSDSRIHAGGTGASTPTVKPTASGSPTPEPSATPSPARACLAFAESLTVQEQAGQLYMVGVSTSGLDETTRAAIRDNALGSVVLLGNTTSGSEAIRLLTAELGSVGTARLPILVSVDQEGGTVQRLQGEGFTRMPSAREQGQLPPGQLTTDATTWGKELLAAGVLYNLAPVGDVVPEDRRNTNAPVGKLKRDFGSDPDQVGAKAQEFIDGMHEAGVLTAVKHFPGLGQVETNTDFGAAEDTVTSATSPELESFRMAIDGGVDSVMVSSAVYAKIDPSTEGMFSKKIVTDLLRGDFGYDGVVISDDLGAAKSVEDVAPAERGTKFIQAGETSPSTRTPT